MSNFCVLNSITISIFVFWLKFAITAHWDQLWARFCGKWETDQPKSDCKMKLFCEHFSISCLFRRGSPLKLSPSCRLQRRFLDDILKTLRRHHFPLRYTQQVDYPKKRRSHLAKFSSSDKANKKFLLVVGMSIVDTFYIIAGFFSYRKMITRQKKSGSTKIVVSSSNVNATVSHRTPDKEYLT